MSDITIYPARKIITMNPARPEATHVAVRDGRILGAGTLKELEGWGAYELDERFADKVLMPGMVEGHAHTMEGTLWRNVYVGYFDRMDPDGTVWPGLKSIDAVLARLAEAEAVLSDPEAPLSAWQLDPIYMDNQRVNRAQLDAVSATRPIGVLHASVHIMNVNTRALELAGLMRKGIEHPGIPLGEDGYPTGELKGPEVMGQVGAHVGYAQALTDCDEPGLRAFAKLCVRQGVTTVTDLAAGLSPESVEMMLRVTGEERYPARVVPLRYFMGLSPADLVAEVVRLREMSTDRLRMGRIKVVADGSIQGFSARMRWPGYYNGAPNGMWYIAPEQMEEIFERALEAGVQIHTHTNGDQATELALEKMEAALARHPRRDHRFTLQHCQLADAAQFRKIAALGMCVNLFANHHFYWGDAHYNLTVGPERAERMNACRTALESGVPMAMHSDAPITPLAPLFTAWCAVNRLTASGRVQGEAERISVDEALYAVTLGAAYTLHLDGEVGSIETGKRADFAVLEEDPTAVDGMALKDVPVWGTVQGGRVFAASEQ
ncbi:amidohydrolase [Phaeobacter sp. 22II1-1F12B]|uniref:amidohydrolase n=1 Tax=Phaeobacter sp. 22II1-1F12B TaxID=1317111 RepID=UPI000B51FE8A|nr:amidohydrolase [Phaeobacter sp. 22II1-1F12B]OWU79132.1 amidohydrolase [Phaeobacter sp. 22II1-1F12B]